MQFDASVDQNSDVGIMHLDDDLVLMASSSRYVPPDMWFRLLVIASVDLVAGLHDSATPAGEHRGRGDRGSVASWWLRARH
jgi:hypothetical protein